MDWNARYQEQDTPWDKGLPTPVLEEIHQRHPGIFSRQNLIAPGCGTGHDVRWLALHGAEATGVDIAPLAIEKARALDTGHLAKYELADFLDPQSPYANSFDQLWEHTCFCALPPALRESYLKAAFRALKPGGKLVGVFFIDPEMDEGETGPPFGIETERLGSMLAEAGFRTMDSWVPAAGFPGRIGRERVMILMKDS